MITQVKGKKGFELFQFFLRRYTQKQKPELECIKPSSQGASTEQSQDRSSSKLQ